ncbi:uncharacterized protein MYCFIDRAFT_109016, partial [Pseudocercospora fijiensis CIRAD86]
WEWYGTEKYPFATLGDEDPLESWVKNGTQLIEEGLRKFPGPFHIRTGTGPKLIVRNRCAQEFAKHPALSVAEALRSDSFADYPGFEAAKVSVHSQVVRDTLLRRVTPALDSLRGKLVADAEVSILENFGESSEWTTASVQPLILDVVAKMSSRPFVGDRLCRDPEWLEVQKQYAGLSAVAASELRNCSVLFRRVRHWMLPSCRSLRRLVRDARALYAKEMRVRSESTTGQSVLTDGFQKSIGDTDSISWLEKESRVSNVHVDIVAAQLQLSMVAIQTTSHVLCHALLHACEHSKFIEPLRNEAIEVIGKHGWSKAGLYHLKLMDCFLKESLRVSQGRLAMARVATEKIVFSDGTVVPKGTGCMLEANFQHENPYAYPEHFDPSRYAQMRNEAGETQSWQYVSSSPDDQGFGYGLHSCPGKFFANNVVKVAFAHLLMFYDWSLDSNDENHTLEAESVKTVNPNFQLRFRRRK